MILRNIALNKCGVVAAGIGHTDAWVLGAENISQRYGISFGKYSTDTLFDKQPLELFFTEDAVPKVSSFQEFVRIRRATALLERGRFSDKVPDWVGTWDVYQPSKGYFELFIEDKDGSEVSGRIEDCLGSARFEGVITPRFVNFVKVYDSATNNAIKTRITYKTEDQGYDREAHQGVFESNSAGNYFYVERFCGNSLLRMSFSWFNLTEDDKIGQKRLC